jgi:hypothetical protein
LAQKVYRVNQQDPKFWTNGFTRLRLLRAILFDQPLMRLALANDGRWFELSTPPYLLVDFPFAASLPLQPECMIGQTISHYRVSEKVSSGAKGAWV